MTDIKKDYYVFPFSLIELPSKQSTMITHLGLPFTHRSRLKASNIICQSFFTVIWWLAFSSVLVMGCVSLTCVPTLYQSSETVSSIFLNFFEDFVFFLRSVAFLCFVSLVGTRTVYTSSTSKSSIFLNFFEKSFKKILVHSFSIKKSRTFFSPALSPFVRLHENYRCQGQSTHHLPQSM